MKGLCRTALAILVIAACGRDGAITEPVAPKPLALQPGVLALGVDSTTGASIETNKDDYSPGEIVHLVGRGWAPGETVNLHMVEEPNTHADVDTNVVADASGGFSIHFYDVQTHDLGVTFTLTATGSTSNSVAVAVFTDGAPTVNSFKVNATTFTFPLSPPNSPATNPITVAPGSTVNVEVNATTVSGGGPANWKSTEVAVRSVGASIAFGDTDHCDDFDVHSANTVVTTTRTVSYTMPNTPGTYDMRVRAIAGDGCSGGGQLTYNGVIIVSAPTNAPPTADAGGSYSGTEGSDIALDGTGSLDSDGSIVTYSWTYQVVTAHATASCIITNPSSASLASIECTDNGDYTVTLTVIDDDGASDDETVALTVTNADPVADAGGPYTGNEGANVSLSGSKSDAGSNDTHTYKWTWAAQSGVDLNAACSFSNDAVLNPTVSCTDDGVYTLTLEVTDDDGATDTDDATLTLSNVAPTFTLTSPAAGSLFSLLNGAVSASAGSISDAGSNDTHECRAELDGAIDKVGSYAPATGADCTASVLPDEAGVYTLTLRVRDDDGGEATAPVLIVVYDPSAGFVTGGGWINSPTGAYVADANLSGKATFGFVSKYKKGAITPDGTTEFQFHAGGMNFHSSTYQWLVVNQAGTNSQFKGTGTINGAGNYTFMLWATDGGNTGDKFRIQITDNSNVVVYDNGVDQIISSGSIVIHTGGKK